MTERFTAIRLTEMFRVWIVTDGKDCFPPWSFGEYTKEVLNQQVAKEAAELLNRGSQSRR
jgi:hypothetical protein